MIRSSARTLAAPGALFVVLLAAAQGIAALHSDAAQVARPLFETSDACIACHNQLTTPSGEDVSLGSAWRATMMANSARDPYWQAAVRREILDHPGAAAEIEAECSRCHMPMMALEAEAAGGHGSVFANLPVGVSAARGALLAADGVSCTACHQITPEGFAARPLANGHITVDTTTAWGTRAVYGRHAVDSGRATIMHSSSAFVPAQGLHVQQSELCAACHTLFTNALDAGGRVVGQLPEQTPYLEWQQSSFAGTTSCQACHMPPVRDSVAISGVWGQPRANVPRHEFLGGNFFVLAMLDRYRADLGVVATSAELQRAVARTRQHLAEQTARVTVSGAAVAGNRVLATVGVENLAGHKFPTAYPSRRAWLHVTVRDAEGRVVFSSGAPRADGAIEGNDNDLDALAYEPHYAVIRSPGEVQIYESVMVDAAGRVTTRLISATRYIKDNRILPAGLDKQRATADVAVHGAALADESFVAGSDAVRYEVDVTGATGPFEVSAALYFQPIAFRWARNLGTRSAAEIARFTSYYAAMAAESYTLVGSATATAR